MHRAIAKRQEVTSHAVGQHDACWTPLCHPEKKSVDFHAVSAFAEIALFRFIFQTKSAVILLRSTSSWRNRPSMQLGRPSAIN
jgi:hypothetical protein